MKWKIASILAFLAVISMATFAVPALAKEDPPPPEKMKKLSFPSFKEFTLENGMEFLVVEHHEQPVVTVYFVFKAGDALDPEGKESLASFTIDQLNKGTESRSALELAEWIESVGGSVGGFSDTDYSAITVSILSDYLDVAYQYLQDVVMNPTFPEDELEILRKRIKTALEIELSQPNAMGRRHFRDLVYGDHPYGKQPTVESVEAITRDDLVSFYQKNYVANNVLVGVVGDVKWKDVRKAGKKYFGELQAGDPDVVTLADPPEISKTKIYLYHRPGAVQTEVFIGHLGIKAKNPDWPAVTVANRILGGGSDARLFMNLREDKGWTYGAYSAFSRERDLGYFQARGAVRTEVTDSAVVEFMSEIERIKTEPVPEEDLKNAKSYLIGNFPNQIETPNQIAGRVAQYKLLGLGKEELETYRDKLAAVEIEDVGRVMGKYVSPDQSYIVLVGDALEIHDKVEKIAPVELFDIAGEPMSFGSLAVTAVEYEYDTAGLRDMKATYSLVAQSMNIGDLNVNVEKKSEGEHEIIEVSTSLTGMVTLDEMVAFRADNLAPVAFKRMFQMGPQSMNSELAFTETSCSGTIQSMESSEPKEVTFDLVGGAILDGTLKFAVGCLPLEVAATYRFPVVDSESGSLQNIDVEVLEEVEVETPAGKFATYKIKVKRPDGESFLYLGKDSPHHMVKSEMPAQMMTMELKSLSK
ncbi:MAG: insulinase family protein [Candidatus Latescibacterota bacterium]|nr:MAG: insulinase family protein [Candidatus Latescibacterota bacterium]